MKTASVRPAGGELHFPEELRGLDILVVDDEDARDVITGLLKRGGVNVRSASSATAAFEEILAKLPDILVSDIAMPGEDGLALIKRIRRLPQARGGRIPAIALTAHARAEDRADALEAGFERHMPKPTEPSELFAVLRSVAPMR